jgi:surface repeat SSSPR-51 protein
MEKLNKTKSFKKSIVALVLTFMMLLQTIVPAFAAGIPDPTPAPSNIGKVSYRKLSNAPKYRLRIRHKKGDKPRDYGTPIWRITSNKDGRDVFCVDYGPIVDRNNVYYQNNSFWLNRLPSTQRDDLKTILSFSVNVARNYNDDASDYNYAFTQMLVWDIMSAYGRAVGNPYTNSKGEPIYEIYFLDNQLVNLYKTWRGKVLKEVAWYYMNPNSALRNFGSGYFNDESFETATNKYLLKFDQDTKRLYTNKGVTYRNVNTATNLSQWSSYDEPIVTHLSGDDQSYPLQLKQEISGRRKVTRFVPNDNHPAVKKMKGQGSKAYLAVYNTSAKTAQTIMFFDGMANYGPKPEVTIYGTYEKAPITQPDFGQVIIQKSVNGQIPAGQDLSGVTYTIYKKANNAVIENLVLDASGYAASTEDLLLDTDYYIKETKAKSFLELDTKTYPFRLTKGSSTATPSVTLNVVDQAKPQTGGISISKSVVGKIPAGQDLSGVTYTIYKKSDNSVVENLVLDASGNASSATPLKLDTDYYVKETKAKDFLKLDPKSYPFRLDSKSTGHFVSLKVSDEAKPQFGKVLIHKTITGKLKLAEGKDLSGIEYKVYQKSDNKELATLTLDASGNAQSSMTLPLNTPLYLKETKATRAVKLNPQEYPFVISDSSTSLSTTVNVSDEARPFEGYVKLIKKVNGQIPAGQDLSGIKFDIFEKASNSKVGTITTDAKGEGYSTKLKLETPYYLQESSTKNFLKINKEKIDFTIPEDMSNVYMDLPLTVSRATNELKLGMVKLTKTVNKPLGTNADGSKRDLSGIKYGIFEEGTDKAVQTLVLDANGNAQSQPTLDIQKSYYIKELTTKPFLLLDNEKHPFKLSYTNEEIPTVSVKVEDKKITGEIDVTKTMKSVINDGLYGIDGTKFRLYNKEVKAKTFEELPNDGIVGEITYNSKGENKFKELEIDRTYYLVEAQPSKNLKRDIKVVKVQFETTDKSLETITVKTSFENEEQFYQGSFPISKYDDDKYGNKNIPSEEQSSLQGDGSYTDGQWKITYYRADIQKGDIATIKTGDLKQIQSKLGNRFKKEQKSWIFKANKDGKILLDDNAKKLKVSGPEFYEKDGHVVWPMGFILAEEVKAPKGYLATTTKKTPAKVITLAPFSEVGYKQPYDIIGTDVPTTDENIWPANKAELEFTNEIKRGDFEIAKFLEDGTCDDNSEIKNGLEGAKFQIINSSKHSIINHEGKLIKKGEVVLEFTTDKYGFYTTKGLGKDGKGALPYGTYTLRETDTGRPDAKPIDDFKFSIREDKEIVKYIVEDKWIASPIRIFKRDIETGEIIAQANTSFQILDADKKPISMVVRYPNTKQIDTFVTDESGTVQLPARLGVGKYYIKEVNAPEGYALDKNIAPFEIKDGRSWNNPLEVTFSNKPQKVQVSVYKQLLSSIDGQKIELTPEVKKQLAQLKFEYIAEEDIVLNKQTKFKKGDKVGEYGLDVETLKSVSEPLYPGKYRIKETNIPEGILVPTEDTIVDLKADHAQQEKEVLEFASDVINKVNGTKLIKVDKETQKPLAGIEFEYWKDENNKFKALTDENGLIKLENLSNGKWNIKESKALPGYVLSKKVFNLNVDEKSHLTNPTELKIENIKTTSIFKKVDEKGKPLANAWMTLIDPNGKFVNPNEYSKEPIDVIEFKSQSDLDKAIEEESKKADQKLQQDTLAQIKDQQVKKIPEDFNTQIKESFKDGLKDKNVLKAVDLALESGQKNNFLIDESKYNEENTDPALLKAIKEVNVCLKAKFMNPHKENTQPATDGMIEEDKVEERTIYVWNTKDADVVLKGLQPGNYIYAEVKAPKHADKYKKYELASLRQIVVQPTDKPQTFTIVDKEINLEKPCPPCPPCPPEKPAEPNKPNEPNKPQMPVERGTFVEHHIYREYDKSGKIIKEDKVDKKKVFGTSKETYETSKIDKDGYIMVYVKGNEGSKFDETGKKTTGNFIPNKNLEVTYFYVKCGKCEEVVTNFVDEEGNKLADTEKGAQPKKDIDGYEFVKTTKDEKGNITHIYKKINKVVTDFVDEEGNKLAKTEDGAQPKKDIEGYEFVKTVKDEKGNIKHIYKKINKVITDFVDEEGNKLAKTEDGAQPKKDIEGYEFVKTVKDEKGNIKHIYRKVKKPEQGPGKDLPKTDARHKETKDHTMIYVIAGLALVACGTGLYIKKSKKSKESQSK